MLHNEDNYNTAEGLFNAECHMLCFYRNVQSDLTDEAQIVHISARMHLTDVLIFYYS